jgi:hypothetical protein
MGNAMLSGELSSFNKETDILLWQHTLIAALVSTLLACKFPFQILQ